MSTPVKRLPALHGFSWWLACVLALLSASAAASGLRSVSLAAAGHPESALAAVWAGPDARAGMIELGLESALYAIVAEHPATALILQVRAAQPGSRVSVRQRSVTYLNIDRDGPHIAVPGTEARGAWTTLAAASADSFLLQDTVKQTVRMDRRRLAAALADQPTWLALAQACRGQDEDACYSVTDPEFEITVTTADGRSTRAIVRVEYPNGC